MNPYQERSNNHRNKPSQPTYDSNYYPGGPRPPQRQQNTQQTGVRATMPPPAGNGFALPPPTPGQQRVQPVEDLDGTMAHPNDPFWLRRRYTRNDSFPELRQLDLQNPQSFQQPQHQQSHSERNHQQQQVPSRSQRSHQQSQHNEHSRSRRKHQHRQQGPPRQSSKQGDRSYPKPPTQPFPQQKPVAVAQFHQPQNQNSRQHRHHQQQQPQPQPQQFNQQQPQRHGNKRRVKRDVAQPQITQTPKFGEQQGGFRLPPFSPNFKGPRPNSQFAPPSATPPAHLPKSSSKPRFQSNFSAPQQQVSSHQGFASGSSFTPQPQRPQKRHQQPPVQMVPRRGRQIKEELGLEVLMSKTFAKKKNLIPGRPVPTPENRQGAPPVPPKVPSRQMRSRDFEDAI